MNKKRRIYKGFNKRRKSKEIKIAILGITVCLIGGYALIKIKDNFELNKILDKSLISKLENKLNLNKEKTEESGPEKENKEEVIKNEEDKTDEAASSEDIKLAKIDGWNIYTVQVASIENENDMPKIEEQLNKCKIPFSVVEIDGLKKVQTYASFDKENTRGYIDEVKKEFPDAFLSEMKVPLLSLEYTSRYAYVENISSELKNLISNFEDESKFWVDNKDNVDISSYKKILDERKKVIKNIQDETDKIDYSSIEIFKQNLIKYANDINEKVELASKAANEENYHVSKSLFLSSMQGYYSFINSIKGA